MFAAIKGEWLLPESLFLYGFSEEVAVVVSMSQMGSIPHVSMNYKKCRNPINQS